LQLQTAGSYTLTASAAGVGSATSSHFTVTAAAASQLGFVANPSNALAGQILPDVLVSVRDAFGNPVTSSAQFTLTVSGLGGLSAGTPSAQAVNGVADFSGLVLKTAGSYTFTVSASGLAPITSGSFTISPAAPTQLFFSTGPANSGAGQTLPDIFVAVQDPYGNFVSGTVVSLSATGPGGFSAGNTTAASVGGQADFSGLVLQSAGNYTLTASAAGLSSVPSSAFTVSPAAASQLAFEGGVANTIAGQTVPTFKVDVRDVFGNLITSSGAVVALTVTGPGAPTAGTMTVSAVGGVATFTGLVLQSAGAYTFTASTTGLTAGKSNTFTVSPAAANQLGFSADPADSTAGQALASIQAAVEDSFGNPIAGANAQVTIAAQGPGSFTTGTTVEPTAAGMVAFNNLVLQTAGLYTLTVSAPGLQPATSTIFTVNPAAASQLAFKASPSNATAGAALPTIQVDVVDPFGNTVTSSSAAMTLAVGGPGALSQGSTTARAAGGVASFPNLVFQTAGSYVLTVSSAGLQSITTPSITVNPAPASQLAFAVNPVNTTAGQAVPAFQVSVTDAFGNPVSGTAVSLTVNGGRPSAGATSSTSVGGLATFSGLVFPTAGQYTVAASATGLPTITSAGFTVSPALPTALNFVTSPGNTTAGQPLPTLQVALHDAFGNPTTDSGIVVMLGGTGPASVSASATTAQGVATFDTLALQTAGLYTLTASAPGLQAAATASFTVSPAAASQITFTSGPANTTAGVTMPALQVAIRDTFGNLVNSNIPLSIAANGPGSFTAGATSATPVGGSATFSGLVLQTAGSYTFTVSGNGLTAGTSAPVAITAAAGSQLAVEAIPSGGTAGAILTNVQVDILDPFGNLSTSNTPVTLAINGPGAPAAGNTTAQAVGGVATFTGLVLPTAGAYSFTASAASLTPAGSGTFTVSAAAANHLVFETLPATATAGQTLPDLRVDVLDPFGNLTTSNTSVTLAVSGPGIQPGGQTTLQAVNGVAIFSGVVLPKAGDYNIFVTAPGLAPAASGNFVASPVPGSTPPAGGSADKLPTTTVAPAKIKFLSAPQSIHAGKHLAPVRVQVFDAKGHHLAAGTLVTLRLTSGKITGILRRRTDAHGSIVFTKLTVMRAGHYTLVATAQGLKTAFAQRLTILPAK
jgi:hypothetical protein